LDRYKEVEKSSGKKVYICLGLGGDPRRLETVHLIAANDTYPQLFQSHLKETLIWKNLDLLNHESKNQKDEWNLHFLQ